MISRTTSLLVAAVLLCVFARQGNAEKITAKPVLNIVVSVAPQKYLVEHIAGKHARVNVMITPGQTPATWDPSPRKMTQLAKSDILFSIGVPFEKIWLPRLKDNFPSLLVYDTRQKIELIPMPRHGHEAAATKPANANLDPHIWLDPLRDIQIAANMTRALCQHDPRHCQDYQHGFAELRQQLLQLHQQLVTILAPCAEEQFMVFHPAWGYFARRYHLHQLAIELSGKEPRGAKLAEIMATAQQQHISTIFVQQQFSHRAAEAIAAQTGARVVKLDPLAENLPQTLLNTARQLKSALEAKCPPSSH